MNPPPAGYFIFYFDGGRYTHQTLPAGPTNRNEYARALALDVLGRVAGANPTFRLQLLPTVTSGLASKVCQIHAINALTQFGAKGKNAIPALKQLKLSSDEDIRTAANKAQDTIESKLEK